MTGFSILPVVQMKMLWMKNISPEGVELKRSHGIGRPSAQNREPCLLTFGLKLNSRRTQKDDFPFAILSLLPMMRSKYVLWKKKVDLE